MLKLKVEVAMSQAIRKKLPAFLLSLTALTTACGGSSKSDTNVAADGDFHAGTVTGVIQYCHDGDTCQAKVASGLVTLRLAGIDAPEVMGGPDNQGQPFGKDARDFLSAMVKGKTVQIRKIELDPYQRTVAEITLGTTLVNMQLVTNGYAEAYKHATNQVNKAAYAAAEEHAKGLKLHIWSNPNYESPSAFRHEGN
jgi:micrococcal nuclease